MKTNKKDKTDSKSKKNKSADKKVEKNHPENEAQKDLEQIRAAGGVGSTHEEGLKIMAAEARRIKMAAEYQSQIQETIHRMASQETADESD